MELFDYHPAQAPTRPILVSVPHAGTYLPPDVASRLPAAIRHRPVDTDWYVDELYRDASKAGIACIAANYSRFVIDLNRAPSNTRLYSDGRPESTLVPTHTFSGQALYEGAAPDQTEIAQRLHRYYEPYHQRLSAELAQLRRQFRNVLLFDGHSIKRHVPAIKDKPFPDMILGNQDGKTCAPAIIAAATEYLHRAGYDVRQNDPFKGGYITRHFGRPDAGIHALQLEMSQDLYMNEVTLAPLTEQKNQLAEILVAMLNELADLVERLA